MNAPIHLFCCWRALLSMLSNLPNLERTFNVAEQFIKNFKRKNTKKNDNEREFKEEKENEKTSRKYIECAFPHNMVPWINTFTFSSI